MNSQWNKLKSFGRHDKHDELVKVDFTTRPNKGENYDEYTLFMEIVPYAEKKYNLSFNIKLVCATPVINVVMTCIYYFKLEVNEEPFLKTTMDDEMVSYLISPYLIAANYMIDNYNKKRKSNPITKDLEYPIQFVSDTHIQTLKKGKIGQRAKLN